MKSNYPLFNGRASVSGIVETPDGKTCTVIHYITVDQEKAINDKGFSFLDLFIESKREKVQKDLEKRLKKATIPMRLDPAVIDGAEIRTRFASLTLDDGTSKKTYEVEVIRGRSQSSGDVFAMMGELAGPRHTGFRYIKIVDE